MVYWSKHHVLMIVAPELKKGPNLRLSRFGHWLVWTQACLWLLNHPRFPNLLNLLWHFKKVRLIQLEVLVKYKLKKSSVCSQSFCLGSSQVIKQLNKKSWMFHNKLNIFIVSSILSKDKTIKHLFKLNW